MMTREEFEELISAIGKMAEVLSAQFVADEQKVEAFFEAHGRELSRLEREIEECECCGWCSDFCTKSHEVAIIRKKLELVAANMNPDDRSC